MKKICFTLFLVVAMSVGIANTAISDDILIISNKSVPDTSLSSGDLQEIFLGRKIRWSNGTKVYIVTSKDVNLHKEFLKTYVKRSATQFARHWINVVFTGRGQSPLSFSSTQKLIEYIENTKGAIGYVSADTAIMNVKTIKVR
jgi:ABC-type phosphate transport system substrate-binding protein